jgi:hypothetical protein
MEQSCAIAVALPSGKRVHGYELFGPEQGTLAIFHWTWIWLGSADAGGAAAMINRIRMKIGRVVALTEFTGRYLLSGN